MSFSLHVILGSHNHLPLGASEEEFEDLYRKRLKPFVVALNSFPKIQAALHYSGVLLHWIEKAHPEFFMLIEDLISRKQVELLGGGFYEPLLPLLSQSDKIGQIEMFTTYIRKQFGKRPRGCWLPALAWEQNLAAVLDACGMGYTFLGEEQFIRAGLSGEARFVPCITEDQGKLVTIFPLSSSLAADAVRRGAYQALEGFHREIPAGTNRIIGLFPAGAEDIERFFEDLSRCEAFAEFTTPGKFFRSLPGLGRAYFPASAEAEPLPAGIQGTVLPRQSLIRYPEANGLYAKMVFTQVFANQLRGDRSRKRTAREELWKAQGADAFRYTANGGIYRGAVRSAAYRALLEAEKTAREKGVFIPSLTAFDFDLDGEDEYLFQDERINCYIKSRGGQVFEFDFLPRSWNYLDTMEPPGSPRTCRRAAFEDFLIAPGLSPEEMDADSCGQVRRCGEEWYEPFVVDKVRQKQRAGFRLPSRPGIPLGFAEIEKIYSLKKDSLQAGYRISNRGSGREDFSFIPRLALAFPGPEERFLRIFKLSSDARLPLEPGAESLAASRDISLADISGLEFRDLKNEAILTFSSKIVFSGSLRQVCFPLEGLGTVYGYTSIAPVYRLSLAPGESWETELSIKLSY